MPQTIKAVVKNRFDTFANLTAANDIPYEGEIVFESDTLRFKVGDGTTAYNSLPYFEKAVPPTEKTVSSSGAITLGNNNYIIEFDTSAGDIAPSLPTGDFVGQTLTIYASGANKAVLTGTGLYVNGVYYTSNTGKHTIVWEGAGWRHSAGKTADYLISAERIKLYSCGEINSREVKTLTNGSSYSFGFGTITSPSLLITPNTNNARIVGYYNLTTTGYSATVYDTTPSGTSSSATIEINGYY